MIRNLERIVLLIMFLTTLVSIGYIFTFAYSKLTNTEIYVDSRFKDLFEAFKEDAILYNKKLRLGEMTTTMVKRLEPGILGTCYPYSNTIVISEEYWGYLSDLQRKALMYHEWGHCTLMREHIEDMMINIVLLSPKVCPVSLMYPSLLHDDCFVDDQKYYIRELFLNQYKYPTIPEEDLYEIIFGNASATTIN